ncbi:MAG: hypothetical protein ACOX7J_04500, partial [Bacillota bacterium]
MKKLCVLLSILLSFTLFFGVVSNAFAVDPNRTYSIGCKYVGGDHDGDDFTVNVNNAYANYSKMPYYSHYKCTMPTRNNMINNQDSGLRMIGHKVVFLNGHANYDNMVFKAGSGAVYRTGIYYGKDYTSPTTQNQYAGIQDTNMNYVKLISFVGCKTASTSINNLAYNANIQGADSAVGFKNTIYTRTVAGENWCNAYNYYLRNGHSVLSALVLASDKYSIGTNLDEYRIYGSTATTLAAASTSSSMRSNSVLNPEFLSIDIDIDMDTD